MKIVFMGTPEFAIPSLDALVKGGYDVCAVVTQPDKPKGRGNNLSISPVKEYALDKGIRVLQPQSAKSPEFEHEILEIKPDLLVTVAYGKILSKAVLNIPPLGCINVHGSLLPKYRGAGPIQWSIINGESKTGITTMITDVGMDTGDMLLMEEVEIETQINAGELHDILKVIGARVLIKTIDGYPNNGIKRIPQDNNKATYAPMMKKETGLICWNKCARDIHNLVRGVNPWPGAYTSYINKTMKIWETKILDIPTQNEPDGKILNVSKNGIVVATNDYAINICKIQFDSGKRMSVSEYLCGHKIIEGEVLGKED